MTKKSFHFMLNKNNLKKISIMGEELHIKKFSLIIEFILNAGMEYLNALYQFSGNHYSKKPEDNERNKDIRITLSEKLYRELKQYHSSKNTYSIAEIVRNFIYFFINGYEEYGSFNRFLSVLEKSKKYFKNAKKILRKIKKKVHMEQNFTITSSVIKILVIEMKFLE